MNLDQRINEMLDENEGLRHCCGQPGVENNAHWSKQIKQLISEAIDYCTPKPRMGNGVFRAEVAEKKQQLLNGEKK